MHARNARLRRPGEHGERRPRRRVRRRRHTRPHTGRGHGVPRPAGGRRRVRRSGPSPHGRRRVPRADGRQGARRGREVGVGGRDERAQERPVREGDGQLPLPRVRGLRQAEHHERVEAAEDEDREGAGTVSRTGHSSEEEERRRGGGGRVQSHLMLASCLSLAHLSNFRVPSNVLYSRS